VTAAQSNESARTLAARVWRYRLGSELEAANRFRILASALGAADASGTIVGLALEAAEDELRHAELCKKLVTHFGGTVSSQPTITSRGVAPAELGPRARLLYEVVALSCVTETLSTALLGELVDRASDSVAKQAMQSILRDEVKHSRVGWAFLAEEHARGAGDCIGEYLPGMLRATFSDDLFEADPADPGARELAGLGALERGDRRRVVCETLELVVFPGLERFGIGVQAGRNWLRDVRR
jgi:Rubrerythrin